MASSEIKDQTHSIPFRTTDGQQHMLHTEPAPAFPDQGESPFDGMEAFKDTSFEDIYNEAVYLHSTKSLTRIELNRIKNALNEIATTLDRRQHRPFFIRQARLSDIDALEGMVAYWARQGENLPRKRNDIIRNIASFAVCIRDNVVCGCACLFVYDSGLAEIRSLGVAPYIQRQGQGRAIVEFLINRARKMEIKKVFVLTRNPEFFARCGFSLTYKEALPEKILKDCENCPKKHRCDEIAYEFNL